jgi:AraC family transcriptional activator of pobA
MDKKLKVMDFCADADRRFVGRDSVAPVPRYFLYGDSAGGSTDWFVNVEPLEARARASEWVIAPHAHPRFGQIVFLTSGGGSMTEDGGLHGFEAPCVIVVPVLAIHGFRYRPDSEGWVLTVATHHLAELARRAPELSDIWSKAGAYACRESELEQTDIADGMRRLDRELDEGAAGGVIAAEACLLTILVSVLRLCVRHGGEPAIVSAGGAGNLVDRFRMLVEGNYRANWSIGQYADALGVSLAQLRAATASIEDRTPLAIVNERLLTEARRSLVYSGRTVAQIAYDLGFEDPAYFTRFFTSKTGQSPARYRREQSFSQHDDGRDR